jgi:hypothetical protein
VWNLETLVEGSSKSSQDRRGEVTSFKRKTTLYLIPTYCLPNPVISRKLRRRRCVLFLAFDLKITNSNNSSSYSGQRNLFFFFYFVSCSSRFFLSSFSLSPTLRRLSPDHSVVISAYRVSSTLIHARSLSKSGFSQSSILVYQSSIHYYTARSSWSTINHLCI